MRAAVLRAACGRAMSASDAGRGCVGRVCGWPPNSGMRPGMDVALGMKGRCPKALSMPRVEAARWAERTTSSPVGQS